jgi:glutaconate CoA-transferase subunit B
MMAVVFAREIEDHHKITSGAHTEIFFAATMLAQKTHAPNLKLQLGGSVALCNVTDMDIEELPMTSTGYDILRFAESIHDHADTYLFYGAPGGADYYKNPDKYKDVNHFWFADKFFVGGIQADKWGNTNMIGLSDGEKMTFRGPGTIGINDTAIGVVDQYAFITAHDKRRLVEQVDYISAPGQKIAREKQFNGGGTKWIVTPKCIFDFDPDTLEARLAQLFPGVTVDDVRENTGFGFDVSDALADIEPPTKDELEVLRNEVDKTGVLRH